MKKSIIFFDGDGTLWYPSKTRINKAPHWVYDLKGSHKYHNSHLILTPTTVSTLKKLKKKNIKTIIISTHPFNKKKSIKILNEKIKHFKLNGLFDEVHASPVKGFYKSKGRVIVKILKRLGIPKNKALMVGDSYKWDYKPARENGIDALLIDSKYRHNHHIGKRISRTIKKLSEVLSNI